MGRARAAARVSIPFDCRGTQSHVRYENTGSRRRGEPAGSAFHVPRVSRTVRRLQSPCHKRQGGDAACSMQDVTIAIVKRRSEFRYDECAIGECALGMRGRRRRPHASRHTRHGTTRSRTGLPERARGVSPAAHRISLPGQAAHAPRPHGHGHAASKRRARPEPTSRSAHAYTAAVACAHTTAKG